MLIFRDILTGDEMISDSFGLKEIDGVLYEVDAKRITIGGENIDIGANPSAEGGGDEGVDDNAEVVIDIVHSFRLVQTHFTDKKSYLAYLKGYMKKVKAKLEEPGTKEAEAEGAALESGAKSVLPNILQGINKNKYEFYIGESMDPDGMVALLAYRDDEITPYFTFWKHGLKGEKV